jgi:hypothetical protein
MSKVTVVAVVLVMVLAASGTSARADSPDFSSCADAGDAFGQCVAGLAQASQSGDGPTEPADGANTLVERCSIFTGQQFGACMAAAAHDRGDPPGAATSDAAHSLVDGCRSQVGRDFGACVRAAAHELGHGEADRHPPADRAGDDSGEADDDAGHPPAHHGKPGTVGKPTDAEKPTQGGRPARPGGH